MFLSSLELGWELSLLCLPSELPVILVQGWCGTGSMWGLAEMQESSSQTHLLLKGSFGGCHMVSLPFFLWLSALSPVSWIPRRTRKTMAFEEQKSAEKWEVMGEQAPSTSDSVCTKSLQLLFSSLHKADDPKPCCKHSKALSSCSKYLNLMVSPTISFT